MKLFYKPGACSLAPHITLRELDTTFDIEKVDTGAGRTEQGADFRAVSPNGYVPALQLDDGTVLTENAALLQYLGDLAPERGLVPPAGTFARVRLQELLSFLSTELHKTFGPFFSGTPLDDAGREQALAKVRRRIGFVEATLSDARPFLTGDRFSVADSYAFAILNWTAVIGLPLEPWPHTARYVERLRSRPAVRAALVAEGLMAGEAAA